MSPTTAVIIEQERVVTCIAHTVDGQRIIFRAPLSEAELAAWKRHPETFFGELSRNHKSESVLDLYDFFMETYTRTPKPKLLEFLAGAPDLEQLAALDQPELASVYCERSAGNAFSRMGPGPKPVLQTKWRATEGGDVGDLNPNFRCYTGKGCAAPPSAPAAAKKN